MGKKYKYSEVLNIFNEYGLKVIGDEYKNSKTKISAIDSEGYIAYINLEFLLINNGGYRKWHKTNPYSIYNINLYMRINEYGTYTIDDEYFDLKKKMKWICKRCGKIFESGLGHVLNDKKCYCNDCSRIITDDKRKHDLKTVIKDFELVGLTILEEYKDIHTCLKCKNEEGYYVYTKYISIKNNMTNFLIFHPTNPYTIENINHYISINNIQVELLSTEYKNSDHDKLEFKCGCGEVYCSTWDSFRNNEKYCCDICSGNKSKGEIKVEKWLKKNNISYISEYRTSECRNKKPLPFDFAIFNEHNKIKAFIEVDGIQHFAPIKIFGGQVRFEERQKLDDMKDDYAKKINAKMIRIPYWEFKDGKYINKLKDIM
nr:MAG TPA: restriction enzyme [Caudoviricetes sp.]